MASEIDPQIRQEHVLLRKAAEARELRGYGVSLGAVSYTHLRAHETVLDIVCRLLLEKKKAKKKKKTYKQKKSKIYRYKLAKPQRIT